MKYVVVDIDGTVSLPGERLKYIREKPKNWNLFYEKCGEDLPNTPIVELVKTLIKTKHSIIYVTGRRQSCLVDTLQWLRRHEIMNLKASVCLRRDGDFRHDTVVKPELLNEIMAVYKLTPSDILFILEDRDSMVKKWRELGYTCLQVAEGNF